MSKIIYNVRGSSEDYSNKLTEVYNAIQNEGTLLHPTLASITASYRDGKAVLMIDQNLDRVVGYVRLTELVNSGLKNKLGLNGNFPNIEEIGTAIILNDPLYRNKGYYPGLRNALLVSQAGRLVEEELLIIGTTKNSKVISALDAARNLSIEFYVLPHLELRNLATFTCTCSPNFGSGFQISETCSARIAPEEAQLIQLTRSSGNSNKLKLEKRVKCTMYVSNLKLARRVEDELQEKFRQSGSLVAKLKELRYYG